MFDNDGQGISGGPQGGTRTRQVDPAAARRQAMDEVREIQSFGERFPEIDGAALARQVIDANGTFDDLRSKITAAQATAYERERQERERSRTTRGMAAILPSGRVGDDVSNFQFRRLILQGLCSAGVKGFGKRDLDRECSDWAGPESERAGESNRSTKGICYSVGGDLLRDVRWRQPQAREISTGTGNPGGGHIIASDFLEAEYVNLLRNASAIMQHARVLSDLVGDVEIPRQSGGRAATWLSETGALGLTDIAQDQISMSPKELGAATQFTRKLLIQSTPDVEELLRADLMATIGLGLDLGAIAGSGASNQPRGILNTVGIGAVSASGTAVPNKGAPFKWADIVKLETEVAAGNALEGLPRYIMHSTSRGHMKVTERATDTGKFIWNDEVPSAPVNGYPVTSHFAIRRAGPPSPTRTSAPSPMKLTGGDILTRPRAFPGLQRGAPYACIAERVPSPATADAMRLGDRPTPFVLTKGSKLWVWRTPHWRGAVVALPVATGEAGGWK